jgi:peptide-methionine (S)-S-oxide reductase
VIGYYVFGGLDFEVSTMERATFAAGCFWGVEEAFRTTQGVLKTEVGYTGGSLKNPTYEQVCSGRTGHAEACLVEFDPTQVTYEELVRKFFQLHDPTTLNRQGPDVGEQYRSAIFFHDDNQKLVSQRIKNDFEQGLKGKTVVTQILPAPTFYPAEDYHQQYFKKRGISAHCHLS